MFITFVKRMIMVERILELLKEKNLTPSQFADEIGIQRSGMSHLISGRNKPSLEFIMKIMQRFPDVKPEYLLFGTTPAERTPDAGHVAVQLITPKASPTLFDQPETADNKVEPKPMRTVKREKSERKIERIVVFYDDKTFREYDPE
jgi:transcriptional regulator with XRE-family HTH domain